MARRAAVRGPGQGKSEAVGNRPQRRSMRPARLAVAVLPALLIWAYWPVLLALYRDWHRDQNYSVGQLVPPAAIYLAWRRRDRLARIALAPCWWGIGVVLFALACMAFGQVYMYESVERYSVVAMIAGLVLLLGGRRLFSEWKWIILFLALMVPLPGRVHNRISDPLQSFSTRGAEIALELIGVTTLREGNVLLLNGSVSVAVAEACSGLRMLTAFVVVAYVFALLIDRPWWQKLVLVASSVPVAVGCNLIRLVVTALLFMWTSNALAETFFHDFAGLSMMPVAVLALLAELWVMSRIVTPDRPGRARTADGAVRARGPTIRLSSIVKRISQSPAVIGGVPRKESL
ncbi:MAG: hypothetical protein AMXMBFR83_13190 [Phycisphaerae bacterium]